MPRPERNQIHTESEGATQPIRLRLAGSSGAGLNSRLAQMPPLFDTTQVLEESELVDFLANKALFSSMKSEIKRTVLSFFGISNVGAPHWERLTFFITLRYSNGYQEGLDWQLHHNRP